MNSDIDEKTMVDHFLRDLFDAYIDLGKVEQTRNAQTAKAMARRARFSLHISIGKLAKLGLHAEEAWAEIRDPKL